MTCDDFLYFGNIFYDYELYSESFIEFSNYLR
jgi:hypothetical protein